MLCIWRGFCLFMLGLILGIVLGDPDKKKYFN